MPKQLAINYQGETYTNISHRDGTLIVHAGLLGDMEFPRNFPDKLMVIDIGVPAADQKLESMTIEEILAQLK